MGPQVPSALPALRVLGCLVLFLWLWTLCATCHRKPVQGQQASPRSCVMPAEASLLRQQHLCTLSKSDTRLHELHRGPRGCRGPRPASMDILRPQWLDVSRSTSRPLAAFSHWELPRAMPAATLPSICPEATYSNVGLAAVPRARRTSSYVRPGPEARPEVAEYACIQKLKETEEGAQSLGQGKAELTPAAQVAILYCRVRKPKKRDPGPAPDQLDPKGRGVIPPLGSDQSYETLPLRGLDKDDGLLENVYESIQEMGTLPQEHLSPPAVAVNRSAPLQGAGAPGFPILNLGVSNSPSALNNPAKSSSFQSSAHPPFPAPPPSWQHKVQIPNLPACEVPGGPGCRGLLDSPKVLINPHLGEIRTACFS